MENNKETHQGLIQSRMMTLRMRGLCVIELTHEGKNGTQRGHSKNDDALDVQMHLKKPHDWVAGEGLRFEMGFEKVRHAAQFESGYEVVIENGLLVKRVSDREADVIRLAMEGKSQRQIAKELGISQPTVGRVIRKAKASGIEFPQKEAK
jgi:ATP/maltotriose-dependent transcriptional regulator MalT